MSVTSFGTRRELQLPFGLAPDCELMTFDRPGRPHMHSRAEVAVAVRGGGAVVVDGVRCAVQPGDHVTIPAGVSHHMEPDEGGLTMMICYEIDLSPGI